jgi:hypothetical protein
MQKRLLGPGISEVLLGCRDDVTKWLVIIAATSQRVNITGYFLDTFVAILSICDVTLFINQFLNVINSIYAPLRSAGEKGGQAPLANPPP